MSRPRGHRGRITNWKDDRGFGFISPDGGGKDVFVHVSSLSNRNRRPISGDSVACHVKIDGQGRTQASQVWFEDEKAWQSKSKNSPVVRVFFVAVLFLGLVAGLVGAGRLPSLVLFFYLTASVVAFIAYAWDKSAARRNQWRTAESTLHLLGIVGGWPGALIARQLFRHKSKKRSFIVAFWVTVALNNLALTWLLTPDGQRVLASLTRAIEVG